MTSSRPMPQQHPGPEEWQRFLLGQLSEPELQWLTLHLQECPDCTRSLPTRIVNAPPTVTGPVLQAEAALPRPTNGPGSASAAVVPSPPPGSAQDSDRIRMQFVTAWKQGQRPQIKDFLRDTPEPECSALLRELLVLELTYRRARDERPQREEYERSFPEHAEIVRAVFCETLPPPPEWAASTYSTLFPQAPATQGPPERGRSPEADSDSEESLAYVPQATPASTPPSGARTRLPAVVGHEILSVLGRGGMGVVYKARHVKLQRLVALKMILAGAHARPGDLERFLVEARAVAHLQHPHIVQVHEIGEQDGLPYFSLEFVEGGSLAQKIAGTPLSAQQAAEMVEMLARAMQVAHQRGIIHRDLKPANVLLTLEGTPKITDFGLAKRLDEDTGRTESGQIMGTPSYMAPEQATGQIRLIGPATDVYALGAILYELLTGRAPFQAATLWEVLDQVRLQEPVPPSRLQPKLPRDLETICLKCLQKEPHKRYASAQALADDLHHFLHGEPIRARPIGLWERGLKWARRRPTAAALVAVSLLALVALVTGSVVYVAYEMQILRGQLRIQDQGNEVQKTLLSGEHALATGDLQVAQVAFSNALTLIRAEPELAEFQDEAERGLAEAQRQLDEQRARQRAVDKHKQFIRQRDEALFQLHADVLTGSELLENPRTAQQAALEALALYGVRLDFGAAPVVDFDDENQEQITTDCYELLLILAEAVAKPLPTQTPEARRRQAQEALRILNRAAQLGPRTHIDHVRRAKYLAQLGDKAGAQQERAQELAQPPRSALDWFLLGYDEWFERKNYATAIQHFDQTLQVRQDHFWAQFFRAASYQHLRNPWEAKASLTVCINQRGDFPWSYLLRSFLHGQSNDFQAAEADFRKAFELASDPWVQYLIYVKRATLWILQRKFDAALDDLQEARRLQPQHYLAYFNLAVAYQEQHKWDAAREALDQAIQLQPTLPSLYHERAHVHLRRQDSPAALQDFEQAIRLQPPGSTSWFLPQDHWERGHILYQNERYEAALKAFEAALALQPDYADAHRWRAQTLLELKRYPEAVLSLDRYLEKGKPLAEMYQARAWAKAQLGDHSGFIDDYTQALRLKPSSALYASRGWMYLLQGAPRLALPDFEKAVEFDPENGDAYNGLGRARVQLGDYRTAIANVEEALVWGPPDRRLFYNAACTYAQAAGLVEAEARRHNRPAPPRLGQYQERALQLLRAALDKTPAQERAQFWWDSIASDRTLAPLRWSRGFTELAAKYPAPAK